MQVVGRHLVPYYLPARQQAMCRHGLTSMQARQTHFSGIVQS